jgi:hypothetical protein
MLQGLLRAGNGQRSITLGPAASIFGTSSFSSIFTKIAHRPSVWANSGWPSETGTDNLSASVILRGLKRKTSDYRLDFLVGTGLLPSAEGVFQESGRVAVIAHRDPPTPPDVRFSASGG